MKITDMSRINGQGDTIATVVMNKAELRIIYDLAVNAYMAIPPRVVGLTQVKSRLNSIRRTAGEALGLFSCRPSRVLREPGVNHSEPEPE